MGTCACQCPALGNLEQVTQGFFIPEPVYSNPICSFLWRKTRIGDTHVHQLQVSGSGVYPSTAPSAWIEVILSCTASNSFIKFSKRLTILSERFDRWRREGYRLCKQSSLVTFIHDESSTVKWGYGN